MRSAMASPTIRISALLPNDFFRPLEITGHDFLDLRRIAPRRPRSDPPVEATFRELPDDFCFPSRVRNLAAERSSSGTTTTIRGSPARHDINFERGRYLFEFVGTDDSLDAHHILIRHRVSYRILPILA